MGTALTSLQKEIQARLQLATRSMPPPSGTSIRIKQGKKLFEFPDGTTNPGPLSLVIVDWRWVNRLYKSKFTSSQTAYEPPLCWAKNFDAKLLAPDPACRKPAHTSCEGCPNNEFGSGDGKGKRCKNEALVAVVPVDAAVDTKPLVIKVSPTGVGGFARFVTSVTRGSADRLPMDPVQIVTSISFDQSKDYETLVFQAGDEHNNLENCWRLKEAAKAILDRPLDD